MDLINVFKSDNVNTYSHPQVLQNIVPKSTQQFSEQNNKLPLLRALLLKQKEEQNKANAVNANNIFVNKLTINPIPAPSPVPVHAPVPIQQPILQPKQNNLKKTKIEKKEDNIFDDSSLESDLSSIDI